MIHTKKCGACGTEYSLSRDRCPKCGKIILEPLSAEDAVMFLKSMQALGQSGELLNQGMQLFKQGRFGETELLYRKATEVCPVNAVAQGNLGHVLLMQEKIEEAIPCIEKALSLDPYLEGAQQALKDARAYLKVQKASLTENQIIQLRKANPQPTRNRHEDELDEKSQVRFVKKYQETRSTVFTKGENIYTYEQYEAESVGDALDFLETKKVTENFYYIEVLTPDGLVGKDILGTYHNHL